MLDRGYVVAATDYPGLGTPEVHPYLVGTSEARAVLDSVRAARAIPEAAAGARFAVWGRSQGGQAALKSRAYTYECLDCSRQTSITAGTAMHRSKLPPPTWFWAAHLLATHSNGMSARQLEDQLGVTHKTAWLLAQKLRRQEDAAPEEDGCRASRWRPQSR